MGRCLAADDAAAARNLPERGIRYPMSVGQAQIDRLRHRLRKVNPVPWSWRHHHRRRPQNPDRRCRRVQQNRDLPILLHDDYCFNFFHLVVSSHSFVILGFRNLQISLLFEQCPCHCANRCRFKRNCS